MFPRAGIAGTIRLASVKCPSGLGFDLEKQTCDWKAKVLHTRGGRDQFFENEALRREMGNETEFVTRNGKQD